MICNDCFHSVDEGRTSEGETDGAPLHPSEAAISASLDEQLDLQRKNLAELRLILESNKGPLEEEADQPEDQATSSATAYDGSLGPNSHNGQVELLQQKIYEAIERAGGSPEASGIVAALTGLDDLSPSLRKKATGPSPEATPSTKAKGKSSANQAIQKDLAASSIDSFIASYTEPLIFHLVECTDLDPKCDGKAYLDPPRYKKGHLAGDIPVPNRNQLMIQCGNPPFVLYRTFQCSGAGFVTTTQKSSPHPTDEVVSIMDADLLSVLKRISKFTFDSNDEKDLISERQCVRKLSTSYTHYFLFHHKRKICDKASGAPDGSPIKLFAQWLQTDPNPMYTQCEALFPKRLVSSITLSWLFPINGVLVVHQGNRKLAYVMDNIGIEGGEDVLLSAWTWAFNGQYVYRVYTVLEVKKPPTDSRSNMKIEDLGVYPIGYASDSTIQQLRDDGKKFWKLKEFGVHAYEGWDYNRETYYTSESRWIVDYDFYLDARGHDDYAKNPKTLPTREFDCWGNDLLEPMDAQKTLLPRGIHAYNLKEQKWMYLSVNQLRPVAWNKDTFNNRLILPQRTKSMLKALVTTKIPDKKPPGITETQQDRANSLISRNGRALIMHFHGGPGTGKTFAAAELAGMPLLRVICASLGTTVLDLADKQSEYLNRARKWDSIVVFEGLDACLENDILASGKHEMGFQSHAEIFTKIRLAFFDGIEGYPGIVILTSSGAQAMDGKYVSRCQVTVNFPPLDKPVRRSVWKHCLDQLRTESGISCTQGLQSHVAALSCFQLNGKQINNVLMTARQMALHEKSKLEFKHLRDAAEMATEFDSPQE
ncbi:unnamed protein product [Clonostachys rosea]|uniref:ATPase AAA-type core domain-containing protein n=1 Tax=Bionectria ochroleuca TaxID=29856 RepID=A0ABY6UKH1_BIOOC|nr:unnamed protein product [Clonostachys rosea]